ARAIQKMKSTESTDLEIFVMSFRAVASRKSSKKKVGASMRNSSVSVSSEPGAGHSELSNGMIIKPGHQSGGGHLNDDEPNREQAITSGSEFGRHKVANCRCRNEVFSNVFVAFRCVRGQLSADDAEQAFTTWVENTGS